jgi:hypothetical protein
MGDAIDDMRARNSQAGCFHRNVQLTIAAPFIPCGCYRDRFSAAIQVPNAARQWSACETLGLVAIIKISLTAANKSQCHIVGNSCELE